MLKMFFVVVLNELLITFSVHCYLGEAQSALEKILGELTDGSLKKEEPLSKDQRLGTVARTLVKGAELVSNINWKNCF